MLGRDGLAEVMRGAESGEFDVLIVETLDRLSRDVGDLDGIHKRLSFLVLVLKTSNKAKLIRSTSLSTVSTTRFS